MVCCVWLIDHGAGVQFMVCGWWFIVVDGCWCCWLLLQKIDKSHNITQNTYSTSREYTVVLNNSLLERHTNNKQPPRAIISMR
jgi:hypothetical protein